MKDNVPAPDWIEENKDRLLPVPDFVSPEWLLPKIALQGNAHLLKEIHRWRQEIRDDTGFAWPTERPVGTEIAAVMAAGMPHANFIRVLTRVAARCLDRRKRDGFNLFIPFRKQTLWAFGRRNVRRRHPSEIPGHRDLRDVVRAMIDAGRQADAQAMVYLMCLGTESVCEMSAIAREFDFSALEQFFDAATILENSFDWERDVIEQPNCPTVPPEPRDNDMLSAVLDAEDIGGAVADEGPSDEPIHRHREHVVTVDESAAAPIRERPPEVGSVEPDMFVGSRHGEDAEEAIAQASWSGARTAALDPGTASSPLDAARLSWRQAMTHLSAISVRASDAEPGAEALSAAMDAVQLARAALEAWEAARPRLADAWPMVQRARDILDQLAALARAPNSEGVLTIASGPVMVEPATLQEAETLLDEASIARGKAAEKQQEAADMWAEGGLNLLSDIVALNTKADEAMQVTVSRVGAANQVVIDGAARVNHVAPSHTASSAASLEARGTWSSDEAGDLPETIIDRLPELYGGSAPEQERAGGDVPKSVARQSAPVPEAALTPAQASDMEPAEADPDPTEDPGFELAETEDAASGGAPSDEFSVPQEVTASEFPEPAASDIRDPLIGEIEAKLDGFIRAQAFGLAYHLLRAAARLFPNADFHLSPAELRLAAMTGRIGHGAMQGGVLVDRIVTSAVDAVTAIDPGDRCALADVRRIILSASCADLAMFHPGLPGAIGLDAICAVSPGLRDSFRDLLDAISEGGRLPMITPALLRTVSQEAADDQGLEDCRHAVLGNIESFSKIHFNWVPANKIRTSLHLKAGTIGMLRDAMEKGDESSITAARGFAHACRDRAAIMALVDKIDRGTVKFRGLDGAARERMVSAIEGLVAVCAEYVDAADAAPSARNSSLKALVMRVSQLVAAGVDKAVRGLGEFAVAATPLAAAATVFAVGALTRLKDVVQGRAAAIGIQDHLRAVHGPLFWVPGLHYGSSWLPSPYRPEAIVTSLLDMDMPPCSLAPSDDDFRAAVRARLSEGSFIAARMLIQAGAFHGINETTRAAMAEACDADVETSRSELKDNIDDTRRLVDKVQRMGGLVRIEQSNAALASLDRIEPDSLPSEVSLEARAEDEEPEQVMDFCSASDVVADVRDRVRGLMEAPRADLVRRLDALKGKARPGDVSRVREIIVDNDDLVTAGEYIGFMEDGSTLPETPHTNRRFHDFFPRVPDALGRITQHRLEKVRAAIEDGADMDALPFSRIPGERRAEAIEMLEIWRDLRRRVDRGDQPQGIHVLLERLLTAARLSPHVLTPVGKLPNLPPKTYIAEIHLTIPEDKASLLLPDFGSLTKFNYRVCIVAKMPSDGELSILCRDAGTYGIIILVTTVVEAERRRQLAVSFIGENRSALVIDEAILLHALTEPEFRPLTMIECAQPFSFAAPYRDYGNTAVPPEMFFGREIEIRKISDRMGSCVVYGGRRLGKTALLRHVQALHDDPMRNGSTAVGYTNIRDIGPMPSRIWESASRDLPAIFPAAAKTPAEFTSQVRIWLEGDSKRRVLLLLDEADGFIEGDAKQRFTEFMRLQELMDGTARRFKFVLAGLHNVTRIVRTENSPLKQIASDPQRIGPLMDDELPDAERLVARPLSAMGYEFKNRSDVWRILSHCNYYPVLVQIFCAGLVAALDKEAVRRRRPVWEITERHVREAIENEAIRHEIGQKFDYTIREIDRRYELIACVVADCALHDNSSGTGR